MTESNIGTAVCETTSDIVWNSRTVQAAVSDILSEREILEKRYNQMDWESFTMSRSFEAARKSQLDSLARAYGRREVFNIFTAFHKREHGSNNNNNSIANPEYAFPMYHTDGKTGAQVTHGHLEFGDRTQMFVPVSYAPLSKIRKINKNKTLQEIEYRIASALSADSASNFVSVELGENDELLVERAEGESLYKKTYFDFGQKNKGTLTEEYRQLIREAMHIAHKLTYDVLPKNIDLESKIVDCKNAKLKERNTPEFRERYSQTRLVQLLGLDAEEEKIFDENFRKIQTFENDYDKKHPVWSSNRNPRNKKNKNYDANRIDHEAISRELASVLESNPMYFTEDEKPVLIRYAVGCWNDEVKDTSQRLTFDDELIRSYHVKAFEKNVIDAVKTLDESKKKKFENAGSAFYYEYAPLIRDSAEYAYMARQNLVHMVQDKTISDAEANSLYDIISEKLSEKTKSFSDMKDVLIDQRIYEAILLPWET